jgi:hypothetical protein
MRHALHTAWLIMLLLLPATANADEDLTIGRQWDVDVFGKRCGVFELRLGELSGGPRAYTVFVLGAQRFRVRGPVPVVLGGALAVCSAAGVLCWWTLSNARSGHRQGKQTPMNPEGGGNGKRPLGSEANRTSAVAVSPRAPDR